MKSEELLEIHGGFNISGAHLSYIPKLITSVFDLGRSLGSSIRRSVSGKLCPI